ncbi:MAG: lipopolysaccharide biosynthesis protein [Candidatus Krumholzibacteriia bacterium]
MPRLNTSERGPQQYLDVDHLTGDLRRRSVRGGALTIGNQGAKFILTLGSTAILARILTPEDFGLIAMVMAIIGFIATFKDMGLAMATVQRHDIRHDQVSTLFWINLGASFLIMALTASVAPLFAWLYDEPRVRLITMALAITVIFSGLTVQHQALLRRQMRFAAIAAIEISAMTIGLATAVACALAGLGYWSLVLAPITKEVATAAGVWAACGWRPGRPARRSGVRTLLSFGAHLTGFNLINYFARNLDKVLIGRYYGAAPAGLYTKAYALVLLPIQQINVPLTAVAVPTLSRLQGQLDRFRAYYRRGVMLAVAAGMPVIAFLFVDAERAVLTVLGDQWIEAVGIFRALAPAAFFGTFNVATGWVYVTLDQTHRQFRWGIFASAFTVAAFAVGLRWGALGVGTAFSAAVVLLRVPALVYCFRPTPLGLSDFVAAVWRPFTASLVAGAALHIVGRSIDLPIAVGARLVIDFALYLVCYAVVWVGLPHGRRSAIDLLRLARELRPARPPAADETAEPLH